MTPDQEWSLYYGIVCDLENARDGIKKFNPTGTQMTSDLRRLQDMIDFYNRVLEEEFEFEDAEEQTPSI